MKKNSRQNNSKELWRTLKSLGMSSKAGCNLKYHLKENDVVSLNSKENANRFCRFFSSLAETACPKNKFGIKTTEYDK